MANRFLLGNSTSDLATESTQQQVLSAIESQSAPGGPTANVNIEEIKTEPISTNLGLVSDGTQRVVLADDQPLSGFTGFLPTDVLRIGANTVDLNTGNAGTGTQRVVLATDQPDVNINVAAVGGDPGGVSNSNLPCDINALKGGLIDSGNGVVSADTLRVVLPVDQPTVRVAVNEINNTTIDSDVGNSSVATQRVIIASNQPNINNVGDRLHKAANVFSESTDTDHIISPDAPLAAATLTEATCYSQFASPGTVITVDVSSSSANDTNTGPGSGANIIQVIYYTSASSADEASVSINLNGQTAVQVNNDFFRLKRAFVTQANNGVSTASNDGTIYLYETGATVTAGVPDGRIISVIPIGYNRTNYGYFFIPYQPNYRYIVFDYLNIVSGTTGADDVLKVKARFTRVAADFPWQYLQEAHYSQGTNTGHNIILKDLVLDTLIGGNSHGVELQYIYDKPNDNAMNFSISVGCHYSTTSY